MHTSVAARTHAICSRAASGSAAANQHAWAGECATAAAAAATAAAAAPSDVRFMPSIISWTRFGSRCGSYTVSASRSKMPAVYDGTKCVAMPACLHDVVLRDRLARGGEHLSRQGYTGQEVGPTGGVELRTTTVRIGWGGWGGRGYTTSVEWRDRPVSAKYMPMWLSSRGRYHDAPRSGKDPIPVTSPARQHPLPLVIPFTARTARLHACGSGSGSAACVEYGALGADA